MTRTTLAILDALRRMDGRVVYGLRVVKASGYKSGTVYPILRRMEEHGWVTSHWEAGDGAQEVGRPLRRLYRMTDVGRSVAEEQIAKALRLCDCTCCPH